MKLYKIQITFNRMENGTGEEKEHRDKVTPEEKPAVNIFIEQEQHTHTHKERES